MRMKSEWFKVKGILLLFFLSIFNFQFSIASDTLRVEDFLLPEVEVFVIRDEFGNQENIVRTIRHDEIASLPVSSISDILRFLPGLDVRSRGDGQAQTDVSLYGGTFDQVLVCLNGIPVNDAQTGHYAMNIPISTDIIDRIEIRQADAACLNGALTGSVNIITRSEYRDTYSLRMTAGTNEAVHPSFAANWYRGKTHIDFAASYARSAGYYAPTSDTKEQEALQNTDFQVADIYAHTNWESKNAVHRVESQLALQYKDAGLGTGYGYASTDQFDATRTLFASTQYLWEQNHWRITAEAAYRTQYDRYEWHRGTATNIHWTHALQTAFRARHYNAFYGTTTLSAEVQNDWIRSSNMGAHHRLHATFSAEHAYEYHGFIASIGAAGHYNTWFGWYGSGYAKVGYESLFLSASRSLRMPTWTDLFYHAGAQRGSTALKAEQAWTLALNGQYDWRWNSAGQLHIDGNIYYRWGENLIDWTYDPADQLFHATNQNQVNTLGLELSADYRLNAWLRHLSIRYAYTHLSIDPTKTQSNYLNPLRHKIVFNIDHGIYVWSRGAVGANWSLRWQDRAGTYVDIHGTPGIPYTPVLLLDGSIYMDCAPVRVSIECTNMTNRHYYDFGGVLQAGFNGRIVLSARF